MLSARTSVCLSAGANLVDGLWKYKMRTAMSASSVWRQAIAIPGLRVFAAQPWPEITLRSAFDGEWPPELLWCDVGSRKRVDIIRRNGSRPDCACSMGRRVGLPSIPGPHQFVCCSSRWNFNRPIRRSRHVRSSYKIEFSGEKPLQSRRLYTLQTQGRNRRRTASPVNQKPPVRPFCDTWFAWFNLNQAHQCS